MKWLIVVGATITAVLAALLITAVIYAYGNTLFLWEGWLLVGGMLGVGTAAVLLHWLVHGIIGDAGPGWRARLAHWRADPTDPWGHDQESCDLCQRRTR